MENKMDNNFFLTILIPTYNRHDKLFNTLKALSQQTNKNFLIVISDNCSNYDIEGLIRLFDNCFKQKIVLIKNKYNIGGPGNITNVFLYAKTKWVWLLGDDDFPIPSAIDSIYKITNSVSVNIGVIHFPIFDLLESSYKIFSTLSDLIKFYSIQFKKYPNDVDRAKGDLIFMSNKVFNMEVCAPYVEFMFSNSNTRISQLLMALKFLDERKYKLLYINERIVRYLSPENDHWDMWKIARGMASINLLEFKSISYREKLSLVKILMLDWKVLIRYSLIEKSRNIELFILLYNICYRRFLPIRNKILLLLFIIISSNENTFKVANKLVKIIKKVKNKLIK